MKKNQNLPYLLGEYKKVIDLMATKQEYIRSKVFADENGDEWVLSDEYDYVCETYESLKSGDVSDGIDYCDILQNFLHIYVKSLDY